MRRARRPMSGRLPSVATDSRLAARVTQRGSPTSAIRSHVCVGRVKRVSHDRPAGIPTNEDDPARTWRLLALERRHHLPPGYRKARFEVRAHQAENMPVVARIGDEQDHRLDARIPALEHLAPRECLDVTQPGLGINWDVPVRTANVGIPGTQIARDRQWDLSSPAEVRGELPAKRREQLELSRSRIGSPAGNVRSGRSSPRTVAMIARVAYGT